MMIEKIIRDYLTESLSCPVYADVPADPGDTYVVIERTGGGLTDQIRDAMIAVQAIGPSRVEALELHEDVITLMGEIVLLDDIGSAELVGDTDFTDVTTKSYRYQSAWEIVYYGG